MVCRFGMYFSLLLYSHANIGQAGYHWTFEDIKAPSSLDPSGPTPGDWIETLQQARDIAISMNMPGSYASENGFGEISSSMSSPASTFGPESYNVSDRTHRNPLNRSQASLEDTTTTKRNRFSKRQSKQGLGSAF